MTSKIDKESLKCLFSHEFCKVVSLTIIDCHIPRTFVQLLSKIPADRTEKLQFIELNSLPLGNRQIKDLLRINLPNLRGLVLVNLKTTDDALKVLKKKTVPLSKFGLVNSRINYNLQLK